MKINYGCGETKIEDFVNIDIEDSTKPDIVCDLRKGPFPFPDGEVEVIHAIHIIEHIEDKYWEQIFNEFYRVLKMDGQLVMAYPEWEICSKYYLDNHRGMRHFWKACLYGRQSYPGDYHVSPVTSHDIVYRLRQHGFVNIKFGPERPDHDAFTFLVALKGNPAPTKESVFKKVLFGK